MAIWHVAPLCFAPAFTALGVCEYSWLRYNYTCDKQVLCESAGAFFPRDNFLISRGKSHISRVRTRGYAHIFYKYSEAEGSHVFRHYETFRLCETFFRIFLNVRKESSFHFFDILQQNEC